MLDESDRPERGVPGPFDSSISAGMMTHAATEGIVARFHW
jgi:hypothetical protein